MANWSAVLLVLPAVLLAAFDWRKGLFAMLVVAFLQDPARKLEVDQPVYYTVLAGLVLGTVWLRAQFPRALRLTEIPGWAHYLKNVSIVFLVIMAMQTIVSIVRYGNLTIAAIGAMSYLAPLPALMVGHHFALRTGRAGIRRWFFAYLACALVVLPTIALEYAGVGWSTLGQVGEGFEMYTEGAVLAANSGFFRASETAAWHTATAVCLLLLLSSMHKLSRKQMVLAVAVTVTLLTIGVLTGRRKIFVEVVVFMTAYVGLLLYFGKGGLKVAISVFLGGLISYGALMWWSVEQPEEIAPKGVATYQQYAGRSATVAGDVGERFVDLGLGPVQWAINAFGWFGGGLGTASQGAQHFGGGADVFGGSGEGGLGKITAELGVPGLLVSIWFAISALRYGWTVLNFVSSRSAVTARLAYGLVAFLLANLSVFFVATQVFGDVFVLTILGMVMGFFLATPELAVRESAQSTGAQGRTQTSQHTRTQVLHDRA